jgi:hypothetical protein
MICSTCGLPASGSPSPALPVAQSSSTGLVIGAIVCAVVALAFIPPLFGGIALYLGSRVRKTNEGLGTRLMVFAGVCLVAGMVIGVMMFTA